MYEFSLTNEYNYDPYNKGMQNDRDCTIFSKIYKAGQFHMLSVH